MTRLDDASAKLIKFNNTVNGHVFSAGNKSYKLCFTCNKCKTNFETFTSVILRDVWRGCSKCFQNQVLEKIESKLISEGCELIEYTPYQGKAKADRLRYKCKCGDENETHSAALLKESGWHGCVKCRINSTRGVPKKPTFENTEKMLASLDYILLRTTFKASMRRLFYKCKHCNEEKNILSTCTDRIIACRCRNYNTEADAKRCSYVFKKGKKKGDRCPTGKHKDSKYCKTHYTLQEKKTEPKEEKEEKEIDEQNNIENPDQEIDDIEDPDQEIVEQEEKEDIEETEIEEKKINEQEDEREILNMLLPFEENEVRILGTREEPWFVAKDIAKILGYKDTDKALRNHVRDKNKQTFTANSVNQGRQNGGSKLQGHTILINEAGMYSLIFRSKLATAQKFEDWVTSDLLPTLRRQGYYKLSEEKQQEFDNLNLVLKKSEETNKLLQNNLQERLVELKEAEENINTLHAEKEEITETNRKLSISVNRMSRRHRYVKFNLNGPCYYVYSVYDDRLTTHSKIKHGIAGTKEMQTLDDRLKQHRTEDPNMNLELVITGTVDSIVLLEKIMQHKHRHNLMAPSHEVFTHKQDLVEFVENAKKIVHTVCIQGEFDIISQNKLNKFNKNIKESLNES